MARRRKRQSTQDNVHGHVLIASLLLIIVLSLLSMTAFYLASQDVPGISAMREESAAQQLADAAAEIAVSWFHDTATTPPSIAGLLEKRQSDSAAGPSFFDVAGRSQFVGTADHPDILLDASNLEDDRVLNGSSGGFSGGLSDVGRLERVKIYAPLQPGLLGTLEVSASAVGRRGLSRTIQLQLGALNIPSVRAAVQIGQGLGTLKPGGESPAFVHWGDVRVMGDLVINQIANLVSKNDMASVTGQTYELTGRLEDRWIDYWIGGDINVLSPPSSSTPVYPQNVHLFQNPTPGVRLDQWDYDLLKRTALRHGTYYRLDRNGLLHPFGASDDEPGLMPSEALSSPAVGLTRGLVFIDTLDGSAPRVDNLGTLTLNTDYVEALLVVQGHVVIRPEGMGCSVPVLSPSPEGSDRLGSRIPVTLSNIHFRGLLFVAGSIMLERSVGLYGAVIAAGTVAAMTTGSLIEVWYDADLGRGLFRGLPLVYRAPGTRRVSY